MRLVGYLASQVVDQVISAKYDVPSSHTSKMILQWPVLFSAIKRILISLVVNADRGRRQKSHCKKF